MPAVKDITGQRFGMLVAVAFAGRRRCPSGTKRTWTFRCDCGNEKVYDKANVVSGSIVSCGCHRLQSARERLTEHGLSDSPEFKVWATMLQRCHNPTCRQFDDYGGRGIHVCKEWRESFKAFYDYAGQRPSKLHSIDRIDNSRGYEPGNVRWVTRDIQNNNKRNNLRIKYGGRILSLAQYCSQVGLSIHTVKYRINNLRWDVEEALKLRPGESRVQK